MARVELVKDLQAEGFKLDTIARMLDNTGDSDAEILQFSRTVKSLFGEYEPQIVNLEDLRERFPDAGHEAELIARAEKLGLLRKLDDNTYEELAPRVLSAGQDAMSSLNVDARRALKLVEQLRRHAEGVAKLYLELYLEAVWKPFADAGQPDDQWPAVQTALERLRGIAEEALLGMFNVTMAERVDETFGREFARLSANRPRSSPVGERLPRSASVGPLSPAPAAPGRAGRRGEGPPAVAAGRAGVDDGHRDAELRRPQHEAVARHDRQRAAEDEQRTGLLHELEAALHPRGRHRLAEVDDVRLQHPAAEPGSRRRGTRRAARRAVRRRRPG